MPNKQTSQKAKDEWARLRKEEIEKMPSVDFHFGRNVSSRYSNFMIGIYWGKNLNSSVGEFIYNNRIEISFRSPITFNMEFFK